MDKMMGDITLYEKLKKEILKDHPQLMFCGDCPFLMIKPEHIKSYDCPEKHTSGIPWKVAQKNECLLMGSPTLWVIDETGKYKKVAKEYHSSSLNWGTNPKRNNQCLDFVTYLHQQLKGDLL